MPSGFLADGFTNLKSFPPQEEGMAQRPTLYPTLVFTDNFLLKRKYFMREIQYT